MKVEGGKIGTLANVWENRKNIEGLILGGNDDKISEGRGRRCRKKSTRGGGPEDKPGTALRISQTTPDRGRKLGLAKKGGVERFRVPKRGGRF